MDFSIIEIIKLIVSATTSIVIVIIGLSINKRLKVFEHKQWKNQKLIEKRLEIYSELAPMYNDLLCYYIFVGNWKELSPDNIIKHKRIIDKKINLATPLFNKEFIAECNRFVSICYKSYNGWGQDAKLRTTLEKRVEYFSGEWDNKWNSFFCDKNDCSNKEDIILAYNLIMRLFSKEIGLQE